MTFNFDSEVDIDFTFDYKKLYEDVCLSVIDEKKCPYEAEVNLLIVDDLSIRQINKETRNIDKATDVLSFPFLQYDIPADFSKAEDDMDAFNPESGELILGDIILSIDHIKSQAHEYGHSLEREYAFLLIHSMLHLFGFDHIEENDRSIMENEQRIILNKLYANYPILKVD